MRSLSLARVLLVFAASFALASSFARSGRAAEGGEFVIVVNAANRLESLPVAQVAALFLKKATRWPDGSEVKPLERAGDNPVRDAFTRGVLGKELGQLRSYWQQQIFSGRGVPPTELPSDAEVLEAVGAHAGAIGYVAAGARLVAGVKILRVSQ
jgi:ABC-type phosphate transport system substrate-binding protein